MATKKMAAPDIGGLLGKITEKRASGDLPKTAIQHVQPVTEEKQEPPKELVAPVKEVKIQGRPKNLKPGISYVKISPRIPDFLKEEVDVALARKQFVDSSGSPIKTLDCLVELALARLLEKK